MRKITIEKMMEALLTQLSREGECLIWNGIKNNNGYPIFNFEGKVIRVAVLNYYLTLGKPIESGIRVKMKCGNRLCCEPSHVIITHGLNDDALDDILNSDETHMYLAKKHGVTKQYISILRRRNKKRS